MNSPEQRLFNVAINGNQALTNLDIIAESGQKYKALVKQFSCRADAQGKIIIDYLPILSNPKSSGIEVHFVSAPTNAPPVLKPIQNRIVNAGSTLIFTNLANDPDVPAQILTFTLDSNAPPEVIIDSATGIFSWITPQLSATTSNSVTVRVTDNGLPPLSASNTFTVTVVAPPRPSRITANRGTAELIWSVFPGKTYRLQFKNDLSETEWTNWPEDVKANDVQLSFTHDVGSSDQRFYRLLQID